MLARASADDVAVEGGSGRRRGPIWAKAMATKGLPPQLCRDIEAVAISGVWLRPEDVLAESETHGAYLLLLKLDGPVRLARPRRNAGILAPGWYGYAGSARGLGGLEARLLRHFRTKPGGRWHIDQLTPRGVEMAAFAVPGGDECELVSRLSASFGFDVTVPRFGSSDCTICPSHLLVWHPPGSRVRSRSCRR